MLAISSAEIGAQTWQFDFGPGAVQSGYTSVTATTLYATNIGYGLGDYSNIGASTTNLYGVDRGGPDALRRDFCASSNGPMAFMLDVPYSNYEVTVISGDNNAASGGILEESRRWARVVSNTAGTFTSSELTLNIHSGQMRLTFDGPAGRFNAITVKATNTPTIFIAGDSTVTDQGSPPWAGWGQMMPLLFKPGVATANYADSGESAGSFAHSFLPKIWGVIRSNDFLFVQFGHNDEKGYDTTTYTNYLATYISGARQRGALPVLITPVERRRFDSDGNALDTHGSYPGAMRQLAADQGVPLIDLQASSKAYFQYLGPEGTKQVFNYAPGYADNTHFQEYGGVQIARLVVEGIKEANLSLTNFIVPNELPPPWLNSDVGPVGATGGVTEAHGVFTLAGSGSDIGGRTDAFQYVYQPLVGDCEIQARVVSGGLSFKAGVMIRESLVAGAPNACAFISGSGAGLQSRASAGATTTTNAVATASPPYWVG